MHLIFFSNYLTMQHVPGRCPQCGRIRRARRHTPTFPFVASSSCFQHIFIFLSCIYAFIDVCVYFYPPTYFYMTVLESGCIFERGSSSIQKFFFCFQGLRQSHDIIKYMRVRQPCSRQQRYHLGGGGQPILAFTHIKVESFSSFALKTKRLILSTEKLRSNSGFAHCLDCFCHKGIVTQSLS